jgi:hypothetical protein
MTRRWGRDPVRTGLAQAVEDAARQALASSTTPAWPWRSSTTAG